MGEAVMSMDRRRKMKQQVHGVSASSTTLEGLSHHAAHSPDRSKHLQEHKEAGVDAGSPRRGAGGSASGTSDSGSPRRQRASTDLSAQGMQATCQTGSPAKTGSDAPAAGAKDASDKAKSKPVEKGLAKEVNLERTSNLFCGLDTASLSNAGTWLDSRSFSSKQHIDTQKSPRWSKEHHEKQSEGERFVLKRSKDANVKKFGSLNAAFKRLDYSFTQVLTLPEFEKATRGVLNRAEARFLYGRICRGGKQVTLLDALKKMEEI